MNLLKAYTREEFFRFIVLVKLAKALQEIALAFFTSFIASINALF
jgi:hypothetical protein